MEFWGVEVKAGEPLKVQPYIDSVIHISQAALGEVKDVKGAKNVPLRLKVDDKNFIIGSLSAEDRTQLMFDLVLEKEFELSHDWKNGSVYFIGYCAENSDSDGEYSSDGSLDGFEDEHVENIEHGLIKPKDGDGKTANGAVSAGTAANAPKDTAKAATKKEESSDSDDEDESEDDSDDKEDTEDDSDDDMALDGVPEGDSSDDIPGEDSEDDDSSEEELPNPKQSKKRPAGSPQETPVAAKKAKSSTPDKTGNMKGQNAAPFLLKAAAGKTPAGKTPPGNKPKQTPKSGGRFSGKSGNKSFNSKNAKGKRGGK